MSDADPAARTRTLARVIGPYLVVMAATLVAQQGSLPALLTAFMQDGPLVLATGAFTLMAGLAVVAAHHRWKGASAIAISLIGLAAAVKGALLMIAPDLGVQMSAAVAHTPAMLLIAAAIALAVGLWLSVVGWRAKA